MNKCEIRWRNANLPKLLSQQHHVHQAPLSLWVLLSILSRWGPWDSLQILFLFAGLLKDNNWLFLFKLPTLSANNITIKLLEREQLKTTHSKWLPMSQKPLKAVIRGQRDAHSSMVRQAGVTSGKDNDYSQKGPGCAPPPSKHLASR